MPTTVCRFLYGHCSMSRVEQEDGLTAVSAWPSLPAGSLQCQQFRCLSSFTLSASAGELEYVKQTALKLAAIDHVLEFVLTSPGWLSHPVECSTLSPKISFISLQRGLNSAVFEMISSSILRGIRISSLKVSIDKILHAVHWFFIPGTCNIMILAKSRTCASMQEYPL